MIDRTDEKILRELLSNAQQSHREIARRTGVSLGTVVSRKRKMEENGIIVGYRVQIDYEKLGYELIVISEVTVAHGKVVEVGNEISKLSKAYSVYNVTGPSDIMILGRFKTKRELSDFTKSLLQLPNVERTDTHLVLVTFKEDFGSI